MKKRAGEDAPEKPRRQVPQGKERAWNVVEQELASPFWLRRMDKVAVRGTQKGHSRWWGQDDEAGGGEGCTVGSSGSLLAESCREGWKTGFAPQGPCYPGSS